MRGRRGSSCTSTAERTPSLGSTWTGMAMRSSTWTSSTEHNMICTPLAPGATSVILHEEEKWWRCLEDPHAGVCHDYVIEAQDHAQ